VNAIEKILGEYYENIRVNNYIKTKIDFYEKEQMQQEIIEEMVK